MLMLQTWNPCHVHADSALWTSDDSDCPPSQLVHQDFAVPLLHHDLALSTMTSLSPLVYHDLQVLALLTVPARPPSPPSRRSVHRPRSSTKTAEQLHEFVFMLTVGSQVSTANAKTNWKTTALDRGRTDRISLSHDIDLEL